MSIFMETLPDKLALPSPFLNYWICSFEFNVFEHKIKTLRIIVTFLRTLDSDFYLS